MSNENPFKKAYEDYKAAYERAEERNTSYLSLVETLVNALVEAREEIARLEDELEEATE